MVPVLLVDDEPGIGAGVARALTPRGFAVDAHTDPDAFLRAARTRRHRILLIDWNLRTCEGTDLCAALRLEGDMRPIALFSAKLQTDHAKELAKKCGADDFIDKLEPQTWAPRLRALLRLPPARRISGEVGRALALDGNVLTVRNYVAKLRDKPRAVLEVLLDGEFHSREEIARRVWGRHGEPETTLVDNVISEIRKQLGAARDLIEHGPKGWRIRLVADENAREKKLK